MDLYATKPAIPSKKQMQRTPYEDPPIDYSDYE